MVVPKGNFGCIIAAPRSRVRYPIRRYNVYPAVYGWRVARAEARCHYARRLSHVQMFHIFGSDFSGGNDGSIIRHDLHDRATWLDHATLCERLKIDNPPTDGGADIKPSYKIAVSDDARRDVVYTKLRVTQLTRCIALCDRTKAQFLGLEFCFFRRMPRDF